MSYSCKLFYMSLRLQLLQVLLRHCLGYNCIVVGTCLRVMTGSVMLGPAGVASGMTLPATKAACNMMEERKIGKARQRQSQCVILNNPTEVMVFFCSHRPKHSHPARTKLHTKHMCNLGKHTCCFTFACLQRCIPAGSHSTVI